MPEIVLRELDDTSEGYSEGFPGAELDAPSVGAAIEESWLDEEAGKVGTASVFEAELPGRVGNPLEDSPAESEPDG